MVLTLKKSHKKEMRSTDNIIANNNEAVRLASENDIYTLLIFTC